MSLEFSFSAEFQENMLALMTRDLGFAIKATKHIPVERLYSEAHKFLFEKIKSKVESKNDLPSYIEIEDGLKTMERVKRRMLKAFCKKIYDSPPTDPDYIKDKCTEYARKNAFVDIFQNSQTLWNAKKHDDAYTYTMEGINQLYSISFADEASIYVEDFESIRMQYLFEAAHCSRRIPTNIKPLDEILNGGLEKGEFGILLAEAKKGKSIGLIHMGCAALQMRFGTVAHFILEGTTEQCTMRYQSRLSGIPYNRLAKDEITGEEYDKLQRVGRKYLKNLEVVPFNQHWNYTTIDFDGKLAEMERQGRKPDLVVLDYGDLLKGHGKYESTRAELTEVFRDLKRIAMMRKIALWSASQARRPEDSPDKEGLLRAKDIAECYEKCRIADFVATLNQTPREKQLGILRLHADIYRANDTDKTIRTIVDFRRMIFHSKKYGYIESMHPWMQTKKSK